MTNKKIKEKKTINWSYHSLENGYVAILANDMFNIEITNTKKRLPWLIKLYLRDNNKVLFSRSYGNFLKSENKANEIAQSLELL